MIVLGQTVRDRVTGKEGLVIGLASFLTGLPRALLQQTVGSTGREAVSEWIDARRLDAITTVTLEPWCTIPPGAPMARMAFHTEAMVP